VHAVLVQAVVLQRLVVGGAIASVGVLIRHQGVVSKRLPFVYCCVQVICKQINVVTQVANMVTHDGKTIKMISTSLKMTLKITSGTMLVMSSIIVCIL
jgi:hypothetical protein